MPEPLAHIPARCNRAFYCLLGRTSATPFVRRTGWWRYLDLIEATGRSSTERKMRELVKATCATPLVARENDAARDLVHWVTRKGEDGTRYKVFKLNPYHKAVALGEARPDCGMPGVPQSPLPAPARAPLETIERPAPEGMLFDVPVDPRCV